LNTSLLTVTDERERSLEVFNSANEVGTRPELPPRRAAYMLPNG
jgi:hypothetical protein